MVSARTGLRAQQDDRPCGRDARRGEKGSPACRRRAGVPRLRPGGPADPLRGHRQLGRHRRGAAIREARRRFVRGQATLVGLRRVRVGETVYTVAWGGVGHWFYAGPPTDPRARRRRLLDQSGGDRGHGTAPLAGRARWWRYWVGAGTGVRPVRVGGHCGGGCRPAAADGGARGQRGDRGCPQGRRADPAPRVPCGRGVPVGWAYSRGAIGWRHRRG